MTIICSCCGAVQLITAPPGPTSKSLGGTDLFGSRSKRSLWPRAVVMVCCFFGVLSERLSPLAHPLTVEPSITAVLTPGHETCPGPETFKSKVTSSEASDLHLRGRAPPLTPHYPDIQFGGKIDG